MIKLFELLAAIPGRLLVGAVRFYQRAISPMLPGTCRFTPTCSEYMILAVRKHGVMFGFLKGVWRILRCHPWGGHGSDPP